MRIANKNFDEFCIMLDNKTIIFDIIILTEHWLGHHNLNDNQFQIPNYILCLRLQTTYSKLWNNCFYK